MIALVVPACPIQPVINSLAPAFEARIDVIATTVQSGVGAITPPVQPIRGAPVTLALEQVRSSIQATVYGVSATVEVTIDTLAASVRAGLDSVPRPIQTALREVSLIGADQGWGCRQEQQGHRGGEPRVLGHTEILRQG